ncbi:MAG: glycosyltransferase family 9 protein [Planctomycetota bacterium]
MSRPDQPKQIGIMLNSALGDALLMLPAIQAIRHALPSSQVIAIVERPATADFVRLLADRGGDISQVVTLPGRPRRRPFDTWRACSVVRGIGADAIVQSFSSHGTLANLLMVASGARIRIGFDSGKLRRAALGASPVPIVVGRHRVDLNRDAAELLVGDCVDVSRRYLPALEARASGKVLKQVPSEFVVIAAGSEPKLRGKRWSPAKWADLAHRLSDDGLQAVLVGAPSDRAAAREICDQMPDLLDLTGETSIPDLCLLMTRAAAIVGTDGFPLHLADAMGLKTVGLFGPTDPNEVGPYGGRDRGHRVLRSSVAVRYTNLTVGTGLDFDPELEDIAMDDVMDAVADLAGVMSD